MSMNGKRDDFTLEDFEACARTASLSRGRVRTILKEVSAAVADWPRFVQVAGVDEHWRHSIDPSLRLLG